MKIIENIRTAVRNIAATVHLHDKLALGVLLVLAAVTTLGLRAIFPAVTARFMDYEESEAQRDLLRARSELLGDVQTLDAVASVWTSDPTLPDHPSTWKPNPPASADIAAAIYTGDGQLLRSLSATPLPPALQSFSPDHPLRPAAENAVSGGFALLDGRLSLFATKTIPAGTTDNPTRPAFLLAIRPLTADRLRELSSRTGIQIQIFPALPGALSPHQKKILDRLQANAPYLFEVVDTETLVGYTALRDIHFIPIALLRTDSDRVISWAVRITLEYAAITILCIGLIVLITLLSVVHWTVTRPLRRLTASVLDVARTADLSKRVALPQQDEIGVLSREFDRLLQQLGEAQRQLVALSFQDGVHQAGVKALHDIGNSALPVMLSLDMLHDAVRRLDPAALREAASAIARETDPARQHTLALTIEAELERMRKTGETIRELVADATRGAARVESVLREVQSMNRPAIPNGRTIPRDLVTTAIAMLSPAARKDIVIELDDSLSGLPAVRVPAHRIYPVFHAILHNATEAIGQRGKPGRIRVRGESSDTTVSIYISNNGTGITVETSGQLFARGFTTRKRQKSPFDLHWCSNTLQAAGGGIRLASPPESEETVFAVTLPCT